MGGGGSSGVHAMDGQSGDGAREGETLGKKGVVIPRAKPLVQGVAIPRATPLVKSV